MQSISALCFMDAQGSMSVQNFYPLVGEIFEVSILSPGGLYFHPVYTLKKFKKLGVKGYAFAVVMDFCRRRNSSNFSKLTSRKINIRNFRLVTFTLRRIIQKKSSIFISSKLRSRAPRHKISRDPNRFKIFPPCFLCPSPWIPKSGTRLAGTESDKILRKLSSRSRENKVSAHLLTGIA